jgi:alpha-galactosidase
MARFLMAPLAACLLAALPVRAADRPVKVFILAGQSNMEGKAPNELLDHQAADPKTKDLFAHLRKDGQWVVRDDVFVKFLDRKGPLTVGYGSPGRTGVELEFGTVLGDHFEEPVLLVKTAWGGHALYKHFRPPSAGYPAEEALRKELDQAQADVKKSNEKNKKDDPLPTLDDIKKEYGASYRKMLAEVKDMLDNQAALFPALKGTKPELAGFVWFQGWNDQYGGAEKEYEANLKHLIRDVRKDLGRPQPVAAIRVATPRTSTQSSATAKGTGRWRRAMRARTLAVPPATVTRHWTQKCQASPDARWSHRAAPRTWRPKAARLPPPAARAATTSARVGLGCGATRGAE